MAETVLAARVLKTDRLRSAMTWTALVFRGIPKVPALIILVIVVMAVFADFIAPHSPVQGGLGRSLLPPAWMEGSQPTHWLGTDRFGRDVLSRLIYGARVSMSLSFLSIFITATIGTMVGLVSGYFGGRLDALLMRLADVFLAFPSVLIALVLAVVFGAGFTNVVIIVLILLWPRFARQVRGETLNLRRAEYVVLARTMGVSSWTIMWRHIFPNVAPSLLVLATLEIGWVMIMEATLSFLGVGIPPPNPSWGIGVSEGREYLETAWWITLFPAVTLGLTVYGLNMLGDWVRDRLDPKLRQI